MTHSFPTQRSSDLRSAAAEKGGYGEAIGRSRGGRTTKLHALSYARPAARPAALSPAASTTCAWRAPRSEEHQSELQSLMRISYAVFGVNKNIKQEITHTNKSATTQQTNQDH